MRESRSQRRRGRAAAREALLEAVENQLRENDPPETRATLARLLQEGYAELEAKRLIATVLISEMNDMLKTNRPYNNARYVEALRRLPQVP